MIESYNRNQSIKCVLSTFASIAAFAATLAFFYWMPYYVMYNLSIGDRALYAWGFAIFGLLAVAICGYHRWTSGRGHYGFQDSGMLLQLDPVSSGAFVTTIMANRVTTPVYILGQWFLAAPLQLLRAKQCLDDRIPSEHGIESRLNTLLAEVQNVGKWHEIKLYQERLQDLSYLVKMEKVEFSPSKGRVRATK